MSRVAAIHQPECLPWLGFIDKARQADIFIILDNVQYRKNYFHNRNKIRTADGWAWLTIPVATSDRLHQTLQETEIHLAAQPRWREKHLASWRQNYGKTPFGTRYLPTLEDLYARQHRYLADFNRDIILWLFHEFDIQCEVRLASQLTSEGGTTRRLVSLCRAVDADTYLSGISGREYLDESLFRKADVEVRYQEFRHPIYSQRFGPFIPCMSSLDLLFNNGPKAASVLADPGIPRLETVLL